MAKLVLFLTDGTALDVALDREGISIGRRTGNDVCLPYPAVSGKHAMVVTLPTGSVLEDLGSTNGTFVNGKRVSKYFLHDRDNIDIGRQRLVYCTDNNAVVAAGMPWRSVRSDEPGAVLRAMLAGVTESGKGVPAIPAASDPSIHTNTTMRLGADTVSEAALAAFAESNASNMDADIGADDEGVTPSAGPTVRVLTGPAAGSVLPLTNDEMLLGRSGVQVAAVHGTPNGFRLLLVEGTIPPYVNGVAVPADGSLLSTGDVAEIAGVRLEFVGLGHAVN